MKAKRIIPCLDVDNGRVVKGIKFEVIKDVGDPAELAKRYNDDGADELCFMDMGATQKGRATLLDVVKKVAAEISIPLCVGGGIRTLDDVRETIKAGATKVSICSAALKKPDLLLEISKTFGKNCTVLAIDAKRVTGSEQLRWNAFSGGGKIDTGLDVIEWAIRAVELGAGEIVLNSIDADGTCSGYDLELIRRIKNAVPVPVIASGGAGSLDQITGVLLNTANPEMDEAATTENTPGADAALVASLLHFGKTTVKEIKQYAQAKGICFK